MVEDFPARIVNRRRLDHGVRQDPHRASYEGLPIIKLEGFCGDGLRFGLSNIRHCFHRGLCPQVRVDFSWAKDHANLEHGAVRFLVVPQTSAITHSPIGNRRKQITNEDGGEERDVKDRDETEERYDHVRIRGLWANRTEPDCAHGLNGEEEAVTEGVRVACIPVRDQAARVGRKEHGE